MSNPIYDAMAGSGSNMMSMLQALKQNPIQFIAQRKFNVPQNISNDPNAIIRHLMNTGQVTQQRYDQVMRQIGQIK